MPELDGLVGLDDLRDVGTRLPSLSAAPARLPAASSGEARELFDHEDPRERLSPPWSAYVKIAEGCDQSCAFCAIPTFRGRARSRSIEDLLAELRQLAREGVREANLIAQDSTGYGRDIGLRDGLAELVRAAGAAEEAPEWLRIHYLYPGRISAGLLDALASSPRVVRYVDLPLQHAHRDLLRAMRRPGHAEAYLEQLASLREALPDAGVRSAFIVGFPGETDAHFRELCDFVGEAGFDSVGVFTYSHEEGTHALALEDDVAPELKEERRAELEEIWLAAAHNRQESRIGRELLVLTEGEAEDVPGAREARWEGQAPEVDGRVLIEDGAALPPGSFVRVRVTDAAPTELVAVALEGESEK